jgi:hypothetical protein
VATPVTTNANESVVAPMIVSGVVCLWRESGVRLSSLFCVGTFGRNLASVAVMMLSHLITLKKSYKCDFNAISKDNAATNCTTVQHKNVSFPQTLTVIVTTLVL